MPVGGTGPLSIADRFPARAGAARQRPWQQTARMYPPIYDCQAKAERGHLVIVTGRNAG